MGTGFGAVGTSVGALFVATGAGVGTGTVVAGVVVDVGAGVGSDVAPGLRESVGNGAVAAPGLGVVVGTACWASAGSGAGVVALGADVAPSEEDGTVVTATPGVGVCSPQASRAARITKATHWGSLIIVRLFP